MIIRAIKLRITTDQGDFGFAFSFDSRLTVIRASNSSGKSTLFNSLLYALGMEELVGGKGERALVYAVKDYFEYENVKINILTSEVLVELENFLNEVITIRRSIRDQSRDTKLIDVFSCSHLTRGDFLENAKPTYIHDAGSARLQEGFHRFLESFLGLKLPQVATSSGGEAKLYLQTIFAALAVEQKRGWTDYIASIPFYGIRDARTRVVEYLLGLNVFQTNIQRNRLNAESAAIDNDWRQCVDEIRRNSSISGVIVDGISSKPVADFDKSVVQLKRHIGEESISLSEYFCKLRAEYGLLQDRAEGFMQVTGSEAIKGIDDAVDIIQKLSVQHERAVSYLSVQRSSLKDYESLLKESNEDLERNKAVAKLRELGACHGVELASGRCPTCHQTVEDTLLGESIDGPQMDLAMSIGYLDSQRRMLERQIVGLREGIRNSEVKVAQLNKDLSEKYDHISAMRGDISSGTTESKAIARRQFQIEIEVETLEKLEILIGEILERVSATAERLKSNQLARKDLPVSSHTESDKARIAMFQKQFRANAGSFGYESAPIKDIEISEGSLVPCLAQLELREIRTDIKSDSSASDFVRLIWSYLLALQQTSAQPTMLGNHPGILMFDEPGQHSMAVDSQRALLLQLANEAGLQSIVAASFDEAESVFQEATRGVQFKLIEWEGKIIRPLL